MDSRETFTIDSGTVYGPWPTRNVVAGGEISSCAVPTPAAAVGSREVTGGVAGAGDGCGNGGGGMGGIAVAPSGDGGGG